MDKKTLQTGMLKQKPRNNDEKCAQLMEYMIELQGLGFTGYIKINFSQGSVGRVEKFEEILRK